MQVTLFSRGCFQNKVIKKPTQPPEDWNRILKYNLKGFNFHWKGFNFLSNSGKYSQYLIENAHGKDNTLLKELASLPALLSQARAVSPCAVPVCSLEYTSPECLPKFCLLSLQSCHCITSAFLGVSVIIFLSEAVQAGLHMKAQGWVCLKSWPLLCVVAVKSL